MMNVKLLQKMFSLGMASLLVFIGLKEIEAQPDAKSGDLHQEDARGADEAMIDALIEQLGHDEFAVRQRAQSELAQHGIAAFDALLAAQGNEDSEIAFRAQQLIQNMAITWTRPSDPHSVVRLLQNFSAHDSLDQVALIANLASLEDQLGLEALCRIVRYARNELISKEAALAVLNQTYETPSPEQALRAEKIIEGLGASSRRSADWLRHYSSMLAGADFSLETWEQFLADEVEMMQVRPDQSSPRIAHHLVRWQYDQLLLAGRLDEAHLAIKNAFDWPLGSRKDNLESLDWLIHRHAYSLVVDLADHFSEQFAEDVLFQYRLAEVNLALGQQDLANRQALSALETEGATYENHKEAAWQLRQRGLYDWAVREYRHMIDNADRGSFAEMESRIILSDLYRTYRYHREAALELQQIVQTVENDEDAAIILRDKIPSNIATVQARMHYLFALDFEASGDREQHRSFLDEAIQFDPTDADIIIALYRLEDDDEEHHALTMNYLNAAFDRFYEIIQAYDQAEEEGNIPEDVDSYRDLHAHFLNSLAWLVSNTEGDYEQALNYSLESVELKPNTAGYLDTLGRCYYALGNYTEAVQAQKRAVALSPHSIIMQEQLELFEEELARTEHNKEESPQ